MEGIGVEINAKLNNIIMQQDPRRINEYSCEKGISGLLHYILYHLQGALTQQTNLPFDWVYLTDLYHKVLSIPMKDRSKELDNLITLYCRFYNQKTPFFYPYGLNHFIQPEEKRQEPVDLRPLGLHNGLCRTLLTQLSILPNI